MNLPMACRIAQKRAQKSDRVFSVSHRENPRAIVTLPALVPSFKRAGGNVTCYPSPSERPVGIDGGPSFFKGGSRHSRKEREEARATCRKSNLLRCARSRQRFCRAVLHERISIARPSGPQRAASVRRCLVAAWQPARLSARLPARFATTSISADITDITPAHLAQIGNSMGPSGADRPGWSFFVSTPAVTAPA